jgi:predicted NBD/HSP70 family sugar kinase
MTGEDPREAGSDADGSNRRTFICHAGEDQHQAELLAERMEATGLHCWIAPRDIPSGWRYAPAITQAIDRCSVFLILYSEHAAKSTHVASEIEHCAGIDKPILLVRTDSADPHADNRISLFLGSHQWFDASAESLEGQLDEIAADVRALLVEAEEEEKEEEIVEPPESDPDPEPEEGGPVESPVPNGEREAPAARGIGIDVGATKIRGCIVDFADPAVMPEENRYFERIDSPANARTVLDKTQEILERIFEDHFQDSQPVGIGIAVPGQVDLRAGTLKFGPNLFGARNVPFKTHLSRAFPGIPIRVDNEVRCATRCELHLGTGRDFDDFACIFIGKGVGSGTVVDRRIYFGHNYCAGEVGHIKISNTGQPCACGQIGCLETFVKAQAIVDRAEAKAIDWESRELDTILKADGSLEPEGVAGAIEAGDAAAQEVAKEVGEDLGRGIANYLHLLNPAAVIVGGGVMTGFFFHMIDDITRAVQGNALAEVANTPIVQSAYPEEGIAIGASLLFYPEDEWPY